MKINSRPSVDGVLDEWRMEVKNLNMLLSCCPKLHSLHLTSINLEPEEYVILHIFSQLLMHPVGVMSWMAKDCTASGTCRSQLSMTQRICCRSVKSSVQLPFRN